MAVGFSNDTDHVAFVNAGTSPTPNTTAISLTLPSGAESGDFVVVHRHSPTSSSGFTISPSDLTNGPGSTYRATSTLASEHRYKILDGDDTGWSWTGYAASSSYMWQVLRFTGVDTSSPIRDVGTNLGGAVDGDINGSASNAAVTGLNTSNDGDMAVITLFTLSNVTISSVTSGWTAVEITTSGTPKQFVVYKAISGGNGSATDSCTVTFSGSTARAGRAFVLKADPAVNGDITTTAPSVTVTVGTSAGSAPDADHTTTAPSAPFGVGSTTATPSVGITTTAPSAGFTAADPNSVVGGSQVTTVAPGLNLTAPSGLNYGVTTTAPTLAVSVAAVTAEGDTTPVNGDVTTTAPGAVALVGTLAVSGSSTTTTTAPVVAASAGTSTAAAGTTATGTGVGVVIGDDGVPTISNVVIRATTEA